MPSSRKPASPQRRKHSSKLRIILLSIVSLVMIGLVIFIGIAAASTPKWDPALLNDQKQTLQSS